jgi:trimeric intracellular cation channel
LISAPHALVYFGIVIFLVYFKLSSLLLGIHGKNINYLSRRFQITQFSFTDPFGPFENLFCALVFGGIWDSVAKLFGRGQIKEENKDAKKTN